MKKILILTICNLFFACSTSSKKYESIDDFVGEYIAYDENKNPILEGKTFLKIEKKESQYTYSLPEITFTTRLTHLSIPKEKKMINEELEPKNFLSQKNFEAEKEEFKILTGENVPPKDIINFYKAGIKKEYGLLNKTKFELYQIEKEKEYEFLSEGKINKKILQTDFLLKIFVDYYDNEITDKIIFLEKIK